MPTSSPLISSGSAIPFRTSSSDRESASVSPDEEWFRSFRRRRRFAANSAVSKRAPAGRTGTPCETCATPAPVPLAASGFRVLLMMPSCSNPASDPLLGQESCRQKRMNARSRFSFRAIPISAPKCKCAWFKPAELAGNLAP
jgi:hypothetical protein